MEPLSGSRRGSEEPTQWGLWMVNLQEWRVQQVRLKHMEAGGSVRKQQQGFSTRMAQPEVSLGATNLRDAHVNHSPALGHAEGDGG